VALVYCKLAEAVPLAVLATSPVALETLGSISPMFEYDDEAWSVSL